MQRKETVKILRDAILKQGIKGAIDITIDFTSDSSDRIRAGEIQEGIRQHLNKPNSSQLGQRIKKELETLGARYVIIRGRRFYTNVKFK